MDEFRKNFYKMVEETSRVLIIGHINPDPDDIATLLGTYKYLLNRFKDKEVIALIEDSIRDSLNYFNYFENIKWVSSLIDEIQKGDLLIFQDNSHYDMFTSLDDEISCLDNPTICIDHHAHQPEKFTLKYIDSLQSSCSQIIYTLFYSDQKDLLTKEIAENLLMGILGDTGSLRFVSKSKTDCLLIVRELVDLYDLDLQIIDLKINAFSKKEVEVINILLGNLNFVNLKNLPGLAYSFLDMSILDNYSIDEIKSANDKFKYLFLRKVKDYNWGFVVTPDSISRFGVSFRSSKGMPDVRIIAESIGGGGHIYTSGSYFDLSEDIRSAKDACSKLISIIEGMEIKLT